MRGKIALERDQLQWWEIVTARRSESLNSAFVLRIIFHLPVVDCLPISTQWTRKCDYGPTPYVDSTFIVRVQPRHGKHNFPAFKPELEK